MSARTEVLRDIAAAVLEPAELLAAYAGHREPAAERSGGGILTTFSGSYRVRGDVVELDGWCGITETVPLVELLDLAATAGTHAAADRLKAAIADHDRAYKDASRYVRSHCDDASLVLTQAQMQAPEWKAIVERMNAVRTAVAAWWNPAPLPGEQLDMFDQTSS